MFVLATDGGTSSSQALGVLERSLLMKAFLFRIMRQGLHLALLDPIEFKDETKASTTLLENGWDRKIDWFLGDDPRV